MMQLIEIGQRVRIIAERVFHARQLGTVIECSGMGGYFVHLDNDVRPNAVIFFYTEEIEPV